jgi:hypothetical protein
VHIFKKRANKSGKILARYGKSCEDEKNLLGLRDGGRAELVASAWDFRSLGLGLGLDQYVKLAAKSQILRACVEF